MDLYIASFVKTPLKCSGMAHVLNESQFHLHTPRSSVNGMKHTCLFLPAEAGPHLSTPEG